MEEIIKFGRQSKIVTFKLAAFDFDQPFSVLEFQSFQLEAWHFLKPLIILTTYYTLKPTQTLNKLFSSTSHEKSVLFSLFIFVRRIVRRFSDRQIDD